jgi:protein transport protein SEC24
VKEFVENRVSVDVFLCPPVGFVDVASIGNLSKQTGGQVYLYPNFNVMKDGEKLQMDLIRNVTRNTGYDGLLRVRTGSGMNFFYPPKLFPPSGKHFFSTPKIFFDIFN